MAAQTIDEIIAALQGIIARCTASNNRLGYFAALYLKVTVSVKDGIAAGRFEDGPRMEKLDVLFANRYITAYNAWENKQPLTASWAAAFELANSRQVLVLQHLLLGMNAHINLDLGIAAVEAAGQQPLNTLHADFDSINTIISALTYQVLNELGRVSPLLSLLGLHAANNTSVLIQFSIDNARDGAWCFAEGLALKQRESYINFIAERDKTITALAGGLTKTTGFMRLTVWVIHLFEWRSPHKIITVLNEYQKQKIVVSKGA